MAYPSSIDAPSTAMQGTTLMSADDHASDHRVLGSAVINLENKLGIGSGSAAANQVLVGSGAGTASWSGTWNSAVLGTPAITGGTMTNVAISGTLSNVTLGSPTIISGTSNNLVMGTPTITGASLTGGTINSALLGTPSVQRIGSVASSDLRLDADTAGTKVVTITTVRQGGTATDWSVGGTTNFPISNVIIQSGALLLADTSNHTITFPLAFSKAPVVTTGLLNSSGATMIVKTIGTATAVVAAGAGADGTATCEWIAIGER